MSDDLRVEDAATAEFAVRRYLEAQYPGRTIDVKISKIWYRGGTLKDIWEVEGMVIIKRAAVMKERKSFRFQIDPESGDVIGFEAVQK